MESVIFVLLNFLAAMVPLLLISRLILWLLRRARGAYWRVVVANVGSLAIATVIGGFGMADGGPFAGVQAFSTYLVPQLVILLIDICILLGRRSR